MLEEDGELSRKDDKFPQYNARLPRLLDKSEMSGASVIPLAHVNIAAMVSVCCHRRPLGVPYQPYEEHPLLQHLHPALSLCSFCLHWLQWLHLVKFTIFVFAAISDLSGASDLMQAIGLLINILQLVAVKQRGMETICHWKDSLQT